MLDVHTKSRWYLLQRRQKGIYRKGVASFQKGVLGHIFMWWHMVACSCTAPHLAHTELPLQKTGSIFLCWAKSAFDGALISAKERSGLGVLCREEGNVCAQAAIIPWNPEPDGCCSRAANSASCIWLLNTAKVMKPEGSHWTGGYYDWHNDGLCRHVTVEQNTAVS